MFYLKFADVFHEFVALIVLAAVIGAIAVRLRQPLIIGFILVGILSGPSGFGWVNSADQIHLLAQLGLAILLFVVGLKLDVTEIRAMGPVALVAGLGQVVFTTSAGYLLSRGLGIPAVQALYIAVALTFSSTIIIVKLLSDKRDTESLHGRISIGILIVQDIMVVLTMILLAGFSGSAGGGLGIRMLLMAGKGAAFLSVLALVMYFVLPRLLDGLARSSELLLLFAIAWAVALATASELLGFSKEVGAFLAGISLASTSYREIIGARLVSLRDFLLLFFFIDMGSKLDLKLLGSQVWNAVPLAIFVLAGKPLIVMLVMGVMGYRKRTSLFTGLTLAQISEFSLILIALGLRLGHIKPETVGLVTLVGLVSIGLSTYLILYSQPLYERLSPFLGVFERKHRHREQASDAGQDMLNRADILLFGLGRYGNSMAERFEAQGWTVLGVDFDPHAVKCWNGRGNTAVFGDAEDPEFLAMLPLGETRWVVSSIPDRGANLALMQSLKSCGCSASIAMTARDPGDEDTLRTSGADIVFVPYTDAAAEAVDIISAVDEKERRKKMDKLIAGLSGHFIVCGYGRMGQQIVKDFRRSNVPHVVIEKNPIQMPKLLEHNVPYVEGKASEDHVLIKAGIGAAKGLIAVAASDEENVFIVLSARGLNPNLFIVARSILQENEDKLKRAGADSVMSPYILGGHRMSAAALKPRVMDFLDLVVHSDHFDLEIADFTVAASAPFVGKSIKESGVLQNTGVNILAAKRTSGEMHVNPGPDFVINAGDELIVLGNASQIDAAGRLFQGDK